MPTAAVPLAFVPCLLSCAGISFQAPASLIKATRLSSEFRWRVGRPYPMCFPCSILFCCADQRPARNSSKGIIQKKKKKTEREEDQDIRDVPLNKLSNIGGEERQRGHDKRNIGRESTGFNKGMTCIVIVIESGNEQPWYCWTDWSKNHYNNYKIFALKHPLKFSQTITFFHTTRNLGNEGNWRIDGI